MSKFRWARGAGLLTLVLAVAAPAGADIQLVGATQARFVWSAATGPVIAYRVYIQRNGSSYVPHSVVATQSDGAGSVVITASYGDRIRIQVAALGQVEGPRSDVSERIWFLVPPLAAPAPNPTPNPPPAQPGGGTPPNGSPPGPAEGVKTSKVFAILVSDQDFHSLTWHFLQLLVPT